MMMIMIYEKHIMAQEWGIMLTSRWLPCPVVLEPTKAFADSFFTLTQNGRIALSYSASDISAEGGNDSSS